MDAERRNLTGLVAILLAFAALLLAGAAGLPLLDPDEARFARTSVEMARSGDLVVPTFEGHPRLVKPPLLHWLQLALFSVLGATELAARLPAAAAAVGLVALAAWIAGLRFGAEAGLWAAAVLASTPLLALFGRFGTLDALLGLHVFAVVALDLSGRDYPRLLFGLLLGLGFLVKGPVAVVLPLLMILAGRTAAGRNVVPALRDVPAVIAGWSLAVLPWGLAFLRRVGGAAGAEVVRDEALVRYFGGVDHVEPAWFYLPVLALGLMPWTPLLLLAVGRLVPRLGDPATRTARYAAAALLVGVLFFSIGASKLPNYLVPLVPMAALLLTWQIGEDLATRRRTGPILSAAGLAAFGVVLAVAASRFGDESWSSAVLVAAILHLVAAAAVAAAAARRQVRWVYGLCAGTSAVFLALVLLAVLPELSLRRTSAYLVEQVAELSDPDRQVWRVDMQLPSLTHYLDRPVEEVDLDDLPSRLDRGGTPLLVFDEADLARAPDEVTRRLRRLGAQGKFVVLEPRAHGTDSR